MKKELLILILSCCFLDVKSQFRKDNKAEPDGTLIEITIHDKSSIELSFLVDKEKFNQLLDSILNKYKYNKKFENNINLIEYLNTTKNIIYFKITGKVTFITPNILFSEKMEPSLGTKPTKIYITSL